MELNTHCYLGNVEAKTFVEIVDWCADRFGTYGETWRLDWEKHTVYMDEKNAIMFALRWAA